MSKYDDIIHLPHHTSPVRPRMTMSQRAAQFAPFAALSGYDDAIARSRHHHEARFAPPPTTPTPTAYSHHILSAPELSGK